jgi:hypothetical protein
MTPTRLRECLDALGWSARYLGQLLSRDERQVRRWLEGRSPRSTVPWQIAERLESRVRHAEQTPPPRKDAAA